MSDDPVEDVHADRIERWLCEAPPWGATYRVLEDEWDESVDPPVRTIKRIHLVSTSGVVHDQPSTDG